MTNTFKLRPAQPSDAPRIRELVRQARINPLGLDWRRFVVAVSPQEEVIGCGQVKSHFDGSRELASLAVEPGWQGRGAGSAIVRYWLGAQRVPLYLTCRESLGPFYRRLGFRVLASEEMPPYFRRLHRLARWLHALKLFREPILVMKYG